MKTEHAMTSCLTNVEFDFMLLIVHDSH